jgi:hypothetical protein
VQKQVIGNAVAALLFMAIAIVDFTRDTSGIGTVFLVFAAVFVGLAIAGARKKQYAADSSGRNQRLGGGDEGPTTTAIARCPR